KKISLVLAAMVLFAGISFAQDKTTKTEKTEKKSEKTEKTTKTEKKGGKKEKKAAADKPAAK
ncbi:MAG TPA: hypothetical protein VN922_06900, partial [Bacteroidia bacterium]|nr:hypothetical protein [Bacteroidia bacterium]